MARKNADTSHHWHFYRAGGVDQARLDTGADLLAVERLDQKLWDALSCPVKGLEFDERTLAMLDTDHDGRVRAPEIIAAVKWLGTCLKNPDEVTKTVDGLPLASINEASPEGKRLLASARQILSGLGKSDATSITVADTMQTAQLFAQTKFNGDGVVPPSSVDDEAARAVAQEIIDCIGGEMDRSGKIGITQEKLDLFFKEVNAYAAWWQQFDSDPKAQPLGASTSAAHETLKVVRT